MKRFAGLLMLGLVACDGAQPGRGRTDSESHWLEACTTAAACGTLECLCGLCTLPCTPASTECGPLGAEAVCLPPAPACGVGALACTRSCERDEQCGAAHLACLGGGCVAVASAGDAGLDFGQLDAGLPDLGRPDVGPRDMTPPDLGPDMAPRDMLPPDMAPDMAMRPPLTRLPDGPGCLDDAACGRGRCQAEGLDAQDQICGAPAPMANVCHAEACVEDTDCGLAQRCVRAGTFGYVRSACVPARCADDAGCEAGARCLGFFTPCHVAGYACASDADPCRTDVDCPQRGSVRVCLPRDGGGTECVAVD